MVLVGKYKETKVGGETFCLVPKEELLSIVQTLNEALSVDAIKFADLSLGSNLKRKREEVRLTQAQVAKRAGMRQEALSRIESGHGNPTMSTVKRILKAIEKR